MVFLKNILVAGAGKIPILFVACVGIVLGILQWGCASSGLGLQDYLIGVTPGIGPVSGMFLPNQISEWDHALKASGVDPLGEEWKLTVRWRKGKLLREVWWQKGDSCGHFVMPLRERPTPFSYTIAGVRGTHYGPYQPAFRDKSEGRSWGVVMSHERLDYESVSDLKKMLRVHYFKGEWVTAFDATFSVLVTLRISEKGEPTSHGGKILGNRLGIHIYNVTINGEPPDPEEFKGFKRGEVSVLECKVD